MKASNSFILFWIHIFLVIPAFASAEQLQMLPPMQAGTSTICSGSNALLFYSADTVFGHSAINCLPSSTPPFAISPTTGNVGVGTTSPETTLNLVGPNAMPTAYGATATDTVFRINNKVGGTSGGALDFGQNGTSGSWIQSRNAGNYAINYPLLLNPNGGNVGIGTTIPFVSLQVGNGSASTVALLDGSSSGSGGGAYYAIWNGQGNTVGAFGNASAISGSAYSNVMEIYSPNNLVIPSGNVGIGSSVPAVALDVNGTVNATQYKLGYAQVMHHCNLASASAFAPGPGNSVPVNGGIYNSASLWCESLCPTGQQIMSGGCGVYIGSEANINSYPTGGASWQCAYNITSMSESLEVIAFAVCANIQ